MIFRTPLHVVSIRWKKKKVSHLLEILTSVICVLSVFFVVNKVCCTFILYFYCSLLFQGHQSQGPATMLLVAVLHHLSNGESRT